MNGVELIKSSTEDLKLCLQQHQLYNNLTCVSDIRILMENHVFAVWDFMSLLKSLQRNLTCIEIPWLPHRNPKLSRFINEIVLEEETDLNQNGEPSSHFAMYMDAMKEVGASTHEIDDFLHLLYSGKSLNIALNEIGKPAIKEFVQFTFNTINSNVTHNIASAFNYGREDVLPEIFLQIIKKADPKNNKYKKLRHYLQRHIDLDSNNHGPLANELMIELCGNNKGKWNESMQTARQSLLKRIKLWDAINEQILNTKLVESSF